jgi:hypothetical protein
MITGRLLLAGAALAAGCAGGGSSAAGPAVRDSAGIRIVENSGPLWAEGTGWTVPDTPTVDIGGRETEPTYDFDRVAGALRLAGNVIAVANAGTAEVRLYDARGTHMASSGRKGSGPGEYQSILALYRGADDSLLVADALLRRLTVLNDAGVYARSFSLGGGANFVLGQGGTVTVAIPAGWLADGSVIGAATAVRINVQREGTFRDTVPVYRYGRDGAVLDTVARLPGYEMEQMTLNFGGQSVAAPTPVPLGRQLVVAAWGSNVAVARNDAWEIEQRAPDGTIHQLIRIRGEPVALTPEDVAKNREEQIEQMEEIQELRGLPEPIKEQFRARIEKANYPATMPFVASMLADRAGNLWVEEVIKPGSPQRRYAVVDSAGRWLGRVQVPARFRPLSVETTAVVGVWKDPNDVEHVRVYPVRKGS